MIQVWASRTRLITRPGQRTGRLIPMLRYPVAARLTGPRRRPEMINSWGIVIRPQEAGGHFWVTVGEASSVRWRHQCLRCPKLRAVPGLPQGGDDSGADGVFVGYAISKASDKPVAGGPAFGAGAEDSLSKEQEKVTGGCPDKGKQMRRKACSVRCG